VRRCMTTISAAGLACMAAAESKCNAMAPSSYQQLHAGRSFNQSCNAMKKRPAPPPTPSNTPPGDQQHLGDRIVLHRIVYIAITTPTRRDATRRDRTGPERAAPPPPRTAGAGAGACQPLEEDRPTELALHCIALITCRWFCRTR
jgi:hypothetical protein